VGGGGEETGKKEASLHVLAFVRCHLKQSLALASLASRIKNCSFASLFACGCNICCGSKIHLKKFTNAI